MSNPRNSRKPQSIATEDEDDDGLVVQPQSEDEEDDGLVVQPQSRATADKEDDGRVVQPQARGKAAAWDSWIAQGGGMMAIQKKGPNAGLPWGYKRTRGGQVTFKGQLVKGDTSQMGRQFSDGPMKGLTIDQAKQKFERMWEAAPEAVREKYASRARAGATKSEIAEADGVNAQVVAPSQALEDFRELTKAPVKTGGEAQSVGNGATAANGYTAQPRITAWEAKVAEQRQESEKTFTPEQMAAVARAEARNQANPAASSPDSSPIERAVDTAVGVVGRGVSGVANSVESMFRGDVSQAAVDKKRSADYLAEDVARAESASAQQAAINKINSANPAVVRPVVAPPSPTMANQVGPPRSMMMAPELTGKIVMDGEVPNGVSSITGLPMGYIPGDNVSGMSPQIQQRAGESVRRQEQAQAKATPITARAMEPANQVVAPVRPPATNGNDPNIIAKYTAATSAYQSSLRGGTTDGDHAKVTSAMDDVYRNASSQDQATIIGNQLRDNKALPTTTTPISSATPRVAPVRQPLVRR